MRHPCSGLLGSNTYMYFKAQLASRQSLVCAAWGALVWSSRVATRVDLDARMLSIETLIFSRHCKAIERV